MGTKKKKEDKERWLSYTNPEYKQENGRWEFEQKDQDNQTLEIYHHESEEEIRELHRTKVMAHIMASMKEESKPKETKQTENKQLEEGKEVKVTNNLIHQDRPNPIDPRSNSSVTLHTQIINKIYEMRLSGSGEKEIYIEVKKEFNVSLMTIGLYLSQVIDSIREQAREVVENTIKDHLEKYEALYKWFNETGYSRASLKALERKEKLLGLYENEDENIKLLNGQITGENDKKSHSWETISESDSYRLIELAKKTIKIIKPIQDIEDEQIS